MTALNAASSYILLDDPLSRRRATESPHSVLEGAPPRLLDEWHDAPDLWNLVRRTVDFSPNRGRFILTGSSVPHDDVTRHTGGGRFIRLQQRTMTVREKALDPTPEPVSLSALFGGKDVVPAESEDLTLNSVVGHILTSGFPEMIDLNWESTCARLDSYIDEISRTDIRRISSVRHEPDVIRQLIVALARSTASEVSLATLARDVRSVAPGFRPETAGSYVELLQRLFFVEAQRPWTPHLRSRALVRSSPKYHLADPSLAAAALGASPARLTVDAETLGLLFESAAFHDLSVFASALGGDVRHYRDSNKREIDAIIRLKNGRWAAVEVKLGSARIGEAIDSLDRALADIDTGIVGDPAFRLVVTGNGPTYRIDEHTYTASLDNLAP
jgi:predicted AAA+ superfamily ATPase